MRAPTDQNFVQCATDSSRTLSNDAGKSTASPPREVPTNTSQPDFFHDSKTLLSAGRAHLKPPLSASPDASHSTGPNLREARTFLTFGMSKDGMTSTLKSAPTGKRIAKVREALPIAMYARRVLPSTAKSRVPRPVLGSSVPDSSVAPGTFRTTRPSGSRQGL